MNNLSNDIYEYYVSHFGELSFDKQLHFASRLVLWSNDPFGRQILKQLRTEVTSNEDGATSLRVVFERAQETIHHGSKNAAILRAPFFQKYPQLRAIAMVLFRLTFLRTIYGIDARDTFFELFPKPQVEALLDELVADHEALAVLSTHAVNVLYLYSRIVAEDEDMFDPTLFLGIGASGYDLDDPIQLQLYIYLYTHCIIGESHFYARPILSNRFVAVYRQMLDELETVIGARFAQINLDNKFEFLVCCKLVDKQSALADRIEEEALKSISEEGTFLVDRHNGNPQTANSTLDLSEHRNILYILTHRETPLAG